MNLLFLVFHPTLRSEYYVVIKFFDGEASMTRRLLETAGLQFINRLAMPVPTLPAHFTDCRVEGPKRVSDAPRKPILHSIARIAFYFCCRLR